MKNRRMTIYILIMFLSGVFQLDVLGMSWEYFRVFQAVHIISAVFIAVFLLVPYVNLHTYEYMFVRRVKSRSGLILGVVLFLVLLSGFYLFFFGNPGSDLLGVYSFYIHLYGSFVLLLFLLGHVRKVSLLLVVMVLLFSVANPDVAEAKKSDKLTNIGLEKGVERYHNGDWTSSVKCKSCHEDIFNQWADSNHRNLVGTNPYYMVLENLASQDMGEEFRQWCMGCHNPSAVTTGLRKTSHGMHGNFMPDILFDSGAKNLIDEFKTHGNSGLEEGVSCVACHRITEVSSSGNSSYNLDLSGRKKYVFEDSSYGVGQWLSEKFINARPAVHKSSYMKKIYKKSSYCASCHDEFLPDSKREVVSTFKEWEKSPYNNPEEPDKHKNCIDCHMTNMKNGKFAPLEGLSTTGGEVKKDIKVHYFAGANHFLSGLKNSVNEEQTIQLLKTAARIDVDIKGNKIIVGVKNVGAGHHLPTGVSDFRELWLDVTLRDRDSKVLYSSGKLKSDGNLDSDARAFMKVFGDENSKPVGLMFWRYKKLLSDSRIPAGKRVEESYAIPSSNLKYPLKVVVKLNFRIYPQWVTDIVKKAYPQLPNPPVIVLNKITKEFESKE